MRGAERVATRRSTRRTSLHENARGSDILLREFSTYSSNVGRQARRSDEPRIRTTLAKQLALYIVLYSPLQMAADLPRELREEAGVPIHSRCKGGLG